MRIHQLYYILVAATMNGNVAISENVASSNNIFDKVWNIITLLGTVASFLGIGIISIIIVIVKNRKTIWLFLTQKKAKILSKGYFTDNFLINNISKSRKNITIFSVRNKRVTEADILQEFRMACARNVNIELYWMSPDVNDVVIDEIMRTLPTPPSSVDVYREQVEQNKTTLIQERSRWSMEQQSRLKVYSYKTLPTMHFCRFDNKIYLGFQMFDINDDLKDKRLGDYAIIIDTHDTLGELILAQINLLNQDSKIVQII